MSTRAPLRYHDRFKRPGLLGDSSLWPPGLPQIVRHDQPYGEDGTTFSLMEVAKKITEGRLNLDVGAWVKRRLKEAGNPKGPVARFKAILAAVHGGPNGRWVPDPTDAEFIPAAKFMIARCKGGETAEDGSCPLGEVPPYLELGDCFQQGTKVLGDSGKLVNVETLRAGDKIWGLDKWTTVTHSVEKGALSGFQIWLSNGSEPVRLTPDHHVFVLDCEEHPMLDGEEDAKALPGGARCTCVGLKRREKRAKAAEIRAGMVLPRPIDFDAAPVDGFYERYSYLDEGSTSLLFVDDVVTDDVARPCWEIGTSDHYVYLPEHDVTVSQCDDLATLYGTSVMTAILTMAAAGHVGCYCAVVGHAYDQPGNIQHVLCAVYAEGRWWYADPSLPDVPFGECKPYTREYVIYVPQLVVGCDATVCLAPGGKASGPPPLPTRGDYMGVSGVAEDVMRQIAAQSGTEGFTIRDTAQGAPALATLSGASLASYWVNQH